MSVSRQIIEAVMVNVGDHLQKVPVIEAFLL